MIDFRSWDTQVEEQGHLGSCTANAMVGMYEMLMRHGLSQDLALSRLFVYYNSRRLEESESTDSGAVLSDVIQAVGTYGICREELWPYQIEKFSTQPTADCYTDGVTRTLTNQHRLPQLADMLAALDHDHLVIFGFEVFENFRSVASPWIIDVPPDNTAAVGAHAMFAVGYDSGRQLILAKNSFGSAWADGGYCWFTFDYVRAHFVDMWTFDILLT